MKPETKARQQIDQKLEQAGWVIQYMEQFNPGAAMGVAVCEYPTDTGPADYVLFVNRIACGVIEAKEDSAGENLTMAESQTERYANATLKWRKDGSPLRFLFEATGQIIRPETLRHRLAVHMPPLLMRNLRDCQISAVTGLEKSLAQNRPRALVHMATGAGLLRANERPWRTQPG